MKKRQYLIGIAMFYLIVIGVMRVQPYIDYYARSTGNLAGTLLLSIPSLIGIAVGTTLLRFDVILEAITNRNRFSIQWTTLLIFGSPFALFNVLIPLLDWVTAGRLVAIELAYFTIVSPAAGVIASILLGLGFLFSLRRKGESTGPLDPN